MRAIIITHGVTSGLIIILSLVLGLALTGDDGEPVQFDEWLGYLLMIVALSVIFVGTKRYRDRELGGVIKFGTAFMLGLGVTCVASVIYVVVWEISLSITDYAFIGDYTQSIIAAKEAEGVSGAELDAVVAEMSELKERYANPLFRVPITFLEIFPVGVLIALISAAVLRKSEVLPATT